MFVFRICKLPHKVMKKTAFDKIAGEWRTSEDIMGKKGSGITRFEWRLDGKFLFLRYWYASDDKSTILEAEGFFSRPDELGNFKAYWFDRWGNYFLGEGKATAKSFLIDWGKAGTYEAILTKTGYKEIQSVENKDGKVESCLVNWSGKK